MNAESPVIETRNLGRRFGRQWVVRNLSLSVPKGSVYGFLGLNGAGKSTTMRMLMGLLTPHEGSSLVLGLDPQSDPIAVKRRVGFVAEKPYFYEWMTLRELVAFVAHYRKEEWDDLRAEHLVRSFKLEKDKRVKEMSKGQQAKVALLLAMSYQPELLILDEPTLGLDPVVRREFVETLLAEYMEGGNTVIISSHLIDEIAGLVDTVGILKDGVLVHQTSAEALRARVKAIRVSFDGDPPREVKVPGLLRRKERGREMLLTVDGFDKEKTLAAVQSLGPAHVAVEELSLENQFIELTSGDDNGGTS